MGNRIENDCGLKIDLSDNGTYIISFGGLSTDESRYCTCELTVDTSTILKGEYKCKFMLILTSWVINTPKYIIIFIKISLKRQYSFILVLRTAPSLEDDIMRVLEYCLNETGDLAGFMVSLRKQLKKKL